MASELVLQIASAPGIQLRVVKRLKQLGLVCTQRTLKDTPFVDTRYLVLELDGPELPKQQIVDQLRGVHGILSIDKLLQQSTTATEEGEVTKTPEQLEITPEEGDTEIRDRMLVFSLLSRYPNLGGRLHEILSTIPKDDRLIRARELGHSFGLHLFKQQKLASPIYNLDDALSLLIQPAVSPMAEIHLQKSVLAVTSSRINVRRKKPQEHACQFLLGALKSLLNSALPEGKLHIQKLCCAADGAADCKFQFHYQVEDLKNDATSPIKERMT
ncbi:MAG: hypothetical protein ABW098_14535 [Candidatus Thiodiazotropha sp.]